MLDEKIVELACRRTQLEMKEQWEQLRTELNMIKTKMAVQGGLGSGATLVRITDLCARAVNNRAHLIWHTLYRFITTTGVNYSDELSSELKALTAHELPEDLPDFKDYIKNTIKILNAPKTAEKLLDQLDNARDHALNKIGTEIDLFVQSLKKKSELSETGVESPIFNMYSPAGPIQTIDGKLGRQLINALDAIKSGINQLQDLPEHPKSEIVDIIVDCCTELEKAKPNITKLRSLLTTVGMLIQNHHSLKSGYDVLKQELTYLGISLS
ncbi:MAG: hypothetical protein OEM61_05710 [Desulfobacteraceae bacterium]|nr:hypothetical protein [Desulfobacteraceae bacterium]